MRWHSIHHWSCQERINYYPGGDSRVTHLLDSLYLEEYINSLPLSDQTASGLHQPEYLRSTLIRRRYSLSSLPCSIPVGSSSEYPLVNDSRSVSRVGRSIPRCTPEAAFIHEHRFSLRCAFDSSSQSPTTNEDMIQEVPRSQYEKSSVTPSININRHPCLSELVDHSSRNIGLTEPEFLLERSCGLNYFEMLEV